MRKTSKELFKSVKIFILGIFNTISDEIKKKYGLPLSDVDRDDLQ